MLRVMVKFPLQVGVETGERKEQDINFGKSRFHNERDGSRSWQGCSCFADKKKKDNKDSSLNADVMPGVATARVRL